MLSRPRISTGVEGPASFNGASAIIEHGADFAEGITDDEAVLRTQRTVLHQHRSNAPRPIQLRFDDRADCRAFPA